MKIAVMGSEPGSVRLAPFNNEKHREWVEGRVDSVLMAHGQVPGDWDIWGCSPACWASIPRATRWFEVHRWEPQQQWFGPQYVDFLRNFIGPVYTGGTVPDIPNHVVYPIDEMEAKFSAYFLSSSLSLMMALAIDTIEKLRAQRAIWRAQKAGQATKGLTIIDGMTKKDFDDELEKDDSDDVIGMWGVDMAATEEYSYQRPGCQFFVLEAIRRGIGVYLPPESDLMRPIPVYGISEWDHNYVKLTVRARQLNQKGAETQAQLKQATEQLAGLQGEQHALNYFIQTWTCPYGMMPGMVLRHEPGTGLGSGITQIDSRPVARLNTGAEPPHAKALEAMTEGPEAQAAREFLSKAKAYREQVGDTTSTLPELLDRLIIEAATGRGLSSMLQPYARAGEDSGATLRRAFSTKAKVKRRRR